MKNLFKNILAFTFLSFLFTGTAMAQPDLGDNLPSNSFDFCGANVTVYCDGSVDVTLTDEVQIFKVYEGGTRLVNLNTYQDPILTFDGTTFNTNQLGNIVNITGNENRWVYFDTDCGQATFNLSQAYAAACPPTVEYCGASWEVDCNGTLHVDFTDAQGINIYKVYNGGQLITEWNNYTSAPDVQYIEFTTGTFPFGNPIPVDGNYYVTIDSDCGQAIINFSQILEQYCSTYNPNSPNYDPTFNHSYVQYEDPNAPNFVAPKGTQEGETTQIEKIEFPVLATTKVEEIVAYPNPVNDNLNVNLPQIDGNYTIQLFNLNGQLLKEFQNGGGAIEMDMNEYEIGLYLLKIQNGDISKVEKIQVMR